MVLVAAIGYGTMGPLAELARVEGVSSLGFATGRSVVAGLLLLVLSLATKRPDQRLLLRNASRRVRMTILAVGVATAIVNVALVASFARVSIAAGLLVFYTYPAVVAFAGFLWFRERLSRTQAGAFALALGGCALVLAAPVTTIDLVGIAYAGLASLGGAVWVLAARHGYGALGPLESSVTLLGVSGACLSIVLIASGGVAQLLEVATPAGLVLTGVAAFTSGAFPMVLFMAGVRRIGASMASGLSTIEPVAGVLLAALLVQQLPTPVQLLGGALVLIAAVILHLSQSADGVRPPA